MNPTIKNEFLLTPEYTNCMQVFRAPANSEKKYAEVAITPSNHEKAFKNLVKQQKKIFDFLGIDAINEIVNTVLNECIGPQLLPALQQCSAYSTLGSQVSYLDAIKIKNKNCDKDKNMLTALPIIARNWFPRYIATRLTVIVHRLKDTDQLQLPIEKQDLAQAVLLLGAAEIKKQAMNLMIKKAIEVLNATTSTTPSSILSPAARNFYS